MVKYSCSINSIRFFIFIKENKKDANPIKQDTCRHDVYIPVKGSLVVQQSQYPLNLISIQLIQNISFMTKKKMSNKVRLWWVKVLERRSSHSINVKYLTYLHACFITIFEIEQLFMIIFLYIFNSTPPVILMNQKLAYYVGSLHWHS
jgi:hypothetical protein